MKSISVLILTIICAITAHVSTYLDAGLPKQIVTAAGAISAIIGGAILYDLRRAFTKEYLPSDWKAINDSFYISISKKEHKKDNPIIACESSNSESGSWNMVGVSKEVKENKEVVISINVNPVELGKFRVRIK